MTPEIDWTDPEAIIRAELEPGEQLLWVARPRQGLILRSGDFRQIMSAVFVFGFIAFMIFGLNRNGRQAPQFRLFAVPILLYTGAVVVVRPLLDMQFRKRMAYGVTSDRVLFVARRFGHRVKSLEIDAMVDVKLHSQTRSGGGELRFGSDAGKLEPAQPQRNWMVVREMNSFELDRDALTVYRMIRQALRTQSSLHDRSVVVSNIAGQGAASWEFPEDAIRPELQPGEILLLPGRPRLGFVSNWIEMFSMIGAFIWMIYFHFLFLGGIQQFGFAFLWFLFAAKLLTVVIKVGRAVNDASLRSRTAYGVTT